MSQLFTRYFCLLLITGLALAGTPARAQCPTPTCTPGRATSSLASDLNGGIFSVTLGSTTYPGGGYSEGYRDSSCGRQGAFAIAGSNVALRIRTGDIEPEVVRVYLDADNNGVFDSTGSELVFSSSGTTHSGTIVVPTTALLNQKLRLRIATDADFLGHAFALPHA